LFCHVENDIDGKITKSSNMNRITSIIIWAESAMMFFSTRNATVFLIFWFVNGLDDNKKQCKAVSFVFLVRCMTACGYMLNIFKI